MPKLPEVTLAETEQAKSRFIVSFRLRPAHAFAGLQAKIITGDKFELSFREDMVWLLFDATSDEWVRQLETGKQLLRTVLSVLTFQTEYPFESEPIQWIEDKPRNGDAGANYVLGKLGDLTAQRKTPSVTLADIRKGEIHFHLASLNLYYRYSLLDYSLALSIPVEAIVFCARSVEWIESYFQSAKQSVSNNGTPARKAMRDGLRLPDKYLTKFFTIANDTVIARHGHKIQTIRPPNIEEVRFCVFFSRIVLDRFGCYIWYLKTDLPVGLAWPERQKSPYSLFEENNPSLVQHLHEILGGEPS